ncbi:hypothetical protein EMCRGX_G003670 [Ephydatia muelleri]
MFGRGIGPLLYSSIAKPCRATSRATVSDSHCISAFKTINLVHFIRTCEQKAVQKQYTIQSALTLVISPI